MELSPSAFVGSCFQQKGMLCEDENQHGLQEILLELVQGYQQHPTEDFDQIREIKRQNLNQIFALYLQDIIRILNQQAFKEVFQFICFYRRALNQHGWRLLDYGDDEEVLRREFCTENEGESALIISNELIIDYLPQYFQAMTQQQLDRFVIIGPSEEGLKNAVYLTQNFSNWMYDNHYSNAKLVISHENAASEQTASQTNLGYSGLANAINRI